MSGLIGEAFAATLVKVGNNIDPEFTNTEVTISILVIFICAMIGSGAGYKFIYKGKAFIWFVFIGHMFLSMVAGLIAFLLCFIFGWFNITLTRAEVYVSVAKTSVVVLCICFVGTDALSIFRRFIKDNLLFIIEKIIKTFERKA